MELLLAGGIGVLVGSGAFLLLRTRTFDVVLGLTLLSYGINLFLFAIGRVAVGRAPILRAGVEPSLANYADPLPQALVLTAIVIGFAMTALVLVLALRGHLEHATDHVDSREDGP